MQKRKSPILELCKKLLAIEVLFIIGYNILIYPYVNAKGQNFSMNMALVSDSITVVEEQGINFTDYVAGAAANLTTKPVDNNAGVFKVLGTPGADITANVVENSITLITGGGTKNIEKISVNKFKLGGSVNNKGRGTIGNKGVLTNVRVGATAHVTNKNILGQYSGTATLRIAYR